MFIKLLTLAFFLLFIICFRRVAAGFKSAYDYSSAKELTEKQMAARFINVAITQYEIRNTHPSTVNVANFEKATEAQDDLVEEYYLLLEQNINDAKSIKPIVSLRIV